MIVEQWQRTRLPKAPQFVASIFTLSAASVACLTTHAQAVCFQWQTRKTRGPRRAFRLLSCWGKSCRVESKVCGMAVIVVI